MCASGCGSKQRTARPPLGRTCASAAGTRTRVQGGVSERDCCASLVASGPQDADDDSGGDNDCGNDNDGDDGDNDCDDSDGDNDCDDSDDGDNDGGDGDSDDESESEGRSVEFNSL